MSNNWLIKLCAEQPTNEAELERALSELNQDQLMALDASPTPSLDAMPDKIAFAEQMGREMAIDHPSVMADAEMQAAVADLSDEEAIKLAQELGLGADLEKVAFLGAIGGAVKGVAAKALGSGVGKTVARAARRNPNAAMAVGGAAAGAAHSKATGGSALGGAAMGAGLGYGAGRLGAGKALKSGVGKAQRWGARAEKSALGGGGPVASSIGRSSAVNMSAPGIQGGLARSKGMQGPLRGTGKYASAEKKAANLLKMMPGGATKTLRSAEAKPTIQAMIAKRGGKGARPLPGVRPHGTPPPIPGKIKAAFSHDHKNEWLEQFEGTPLLQAALDMAKQEIASETRSLEEREARKQEHMGSDELWLEQDKLRLQKKDLELQLIAQRNGLSDDRGEEEDPSLEGMPEEGSPEEDMGEEEMPNPAEETVNSPAGQEAINAIKEAGVKLAFVVARAETKSLKEKKASLPPFQ